ncbi:hypothetical protein BO94DRAFT_532072 [Aspergillus sclerotioniger CBS 115572]|uniref:Uncharacterized protein n=1 Tax=Aspergillus sclerotioniger CBS 115572 TaxID=1450535 RepID=A0A317XAY7_9EURO|nr:hypothetical protein BO94DRAFT_532072 [Aspergillus sclerotioniger CBS 115572]PWY94108.1 hypothetical protein BO94DRAFT_532072 [Aspergillus sclerotioniger CBS 115572]
MAKKVSFNSLLKVIIPKSKTTSNKQDTANKSNEPVLVNTTKGNNVELMSLVHAIEGDMIEFVCIDDDVHFGSPLKRVPTPHPVKKKWGKMVMEE